MADAGTVLAAARQELAGNVRLQYGVVVIGLILAVLLADALLAARDRAGLRVAETQDRLARVEQVAAQSSWPAFAAAAEQARDLVLADLRDASSSAVAEATLQAGVMDLARVSITNPSVALASSEPVEGQPGLHRVSVNISGSGTAADAVALGAALESQPYLIVIEDIEFGGRTATNLSATVSAYFRLPASAIAPGDPP